MINLSERFKLGIEYIIKNKKFPSTSEFFHFFRLRKTFPPFPYFAQIEPTTRCNFNCITCTRKFFSPSRLNRDLELKDFKIILKKIPSLKIVKLQGMGEPFLNPYLKKILKYGSKKGISFHTITNGSLLKYNLKLIKYFKSIQISFDSANKANFEQLRKGSNFEQIIENIKTIVEYRNKKNLKIEIGFNTVVSHLNYKEILHIAEMARKLGIDSLSFVEVENWTTPLERDFKENYTFILESRKCSREIQNTIEKIRKIHRSIKIYFINSQKRKMKCMWPFCCIYVTVDGFITPCCIRMNPEIFNFGNIFEEDFYSIWYGEKYIKFRKSLIKNLSNPICDLCPD